MALRFTPEADAFRAELRAWLQANLDEPTRQLVGSVQADAAQLELLRGWQRRLADAGYAAIAWPPEYGGRGAGPLEQVVYVEEFDRAGAPGDLNPIGMSNIAPAIMTYGTDQQRAHFLPRMLRGDDIWCQGFSEPDAGSDLASLRTRAVVDGDEFVVTGQKVWTTLAHVADWCELLVRTDPDAPKHKGISCLLLDMRLPGVTVRPLRTMTGEAEFNEIFLDQVRVPRNALLGELNAGWTVAMTTLNNERAGVLKLYLQARRTVLGLASAVQASSQRADVGALRSLAQLWLEVDALRLLSEASVEAALAGAAAGPEASLGKLVWSEVESQCAALAAQLLGPAANSGPWARRRAAAAGLSIAGGTTEVNKNVIAQRVLGLPR